MSRACKRHDWEMPRPGDDGLRCRACGKVVRFVGADLSPDRRANILAARERRYGPSNAAHFRRALDASIAARLARIE